MRHDEWDWHLHAVGDDEDLASRILVETAMAMIDVIRGDEMSRLGVCADPDCGGVVVDLSRNRSKRFCSVACGNRNAVAAYLYAVRAGMPAASALFGNMTNANNVSTDWDQYLGIGAWAGPLTAGEEEIESAGATRVTWAAIGPDARIILGG